MTHYKPIANLTPIKKLLVAFRVRIVLILFISIFSLPIILSSCSVDGCEESTSTQPYRYTSIQLIDSTNYFLEIKYSDFTQHYFVGDSYLDSFYSEWSLRISKPQTTMLIRTSKNGWDTLVYSMEKKNMMYIEATKCDEEAIRMEIVGPNIVSHTFDTAFIIENKYPYVSRITLYIK